MPLKNIKQHFATSVPCGFELSTLIEDFDRIRKLKSFMEMKQFN